ncbi:MAG: hypothetical protein LBS20_13280 [Prevotella sp.]|jgi:hypothetical protein|nr:hypothetical protein [Prevotella sp.]
MKTNSKYVSLVLAIMVTLVSCGNKGSKPEQPTATDTTIVAVNASVAVAEMELSVITNENYCFDGKPYVLTIKGGTSFAGESEPYKVEVEKNNFYGTIKLGKFVKNGDAVSVDVQPSTNNQSDEGEKMILIVTDAAGVEKTISLFVPYCP